MGQGWEYSVLKTNRITCEVLYNKEVVAFLPLSLLLLLMRSSVCAPSVCWSELGRRLLSFSLREVKLGVGPGESGYNLGIVMAIPAGLQQGIESIQAGWDVGFPLHGLNESLNFCDHPFPYLQDRYDHRP